MACSIVFSCVYSSVRETSSHHFEWCHILRPCHSQNRRLVGGQDCGTNHRQLHAKCHAEEDQDKRCPSHEKYHEPSRLRWTIQVMTRPVTLIRSHGAYGTLRQDGMRWGRSVFLSSCG